MNLVVNTLLFIAFVFLHVNCYRCTKKEETGIVTSTLATPTEPQDEDLKNSTSSRIPGKISQEKCDNYKRTSEVLVNNEKANRTKRYSPYISEYPTFYEINKYNRSNSTNRYNVYTEITGGDDTEYQEFPHMVLLGAQRPDDDKIEWNCGGSLISENFVLTAAHCVRRIPPKFARIGITAKSNQSHLQERNVSDTIIYPEYNRTGKYHDIALLRLEKDIEFTGKVYPACLHTEKHIKEKHPIAIGWGNTEFVGYGADHLMKVTLDFFTNENCVKKYKNEINETHGYLRRGIIDDLMICAGVPGEVKGTCEGDSGGPLQVRHLEKASEGYTRYTKHNFYDIVGVTSSGTPCSTPGAPGIYTRVSNYIKWIEDTIWPES